jgi:phosphoglycolate phosphatase
MRYKHILWDWNGTLLDDVWLCHEIAAHMLQSHREPLLTVEEYREVFGFPIKDYYRKVGFNFEKAPFEHLAVEFISHYNRRVRECGLHGLARQTLADFQQLGIRQFILSAAQKDDLIEVVRHHALDRYFHDIEGLHNHEAETKVHLGHRLLDGHELETRDVVMLGDTLHDFEVAEALGIDCLLIASGHQSAERMARVVGAQHVVEHLGDIGARLVH